MSDNWLRTHFNEFVYPAFMAAGKKTSEIGKPFHIKPSDKAPAELPTVLKKLWTLCQDMKVPWDYDVREINSHNGHSKYRESARIHHEILRSTLDSALYNLRQEGCSKLFLGGRDVWTFAVMCERRNIPNTFVPELSRNVAGNPAAKTFLESRGFVGDELFLDTGFAGSIPRMLQEHWDGRPFKFRLMSQSDVQVVETGPGMLVDVDPYEKVENCNCQDSDESCSKCNPPPRRLIKQGYKLRPNQLFPNRKSARSEAIETEYLAKYWKTGTVEPVMERKVWNAQEASRAFMGRNLRRFPIDLRSYPDGAGSINPHAPLKQQISKCAMSSDYILKTSMVICHDGKIALVNINDAKRLSPGFYEWYLSLPVIDIPDAETYRVVQYFADTRSIQRAALLTSMLWRGIPYWKSAMKSKEPQKFVGNPMVTYVGTNNFGTTDNTYTTNSITSNTYLNVNYGTALVMNEATINTAYTPGMGTVSKQYLEAVTAGNAFASKHKQEMGLITFSQDGRTKPIIQKTDMQEQIKPMPIIMINPPCP